MRTTPSVTRHPWSLPRRLLLGAALLLPGALSAQSPFPLKNAGSVMELPGGTKVTAGAPRGDLAKVRNAVQVSGNFLLLADGKVVPLFAPFSAPLLTDIIAIAAAGENFEALIAVNKDRKLVTHNITVPLPSSVATLSDVQDVEWYPGSTRDGLSAVTVWSISGGPITLRTRRDFVSVAFTGAGYVIGRGVTYRDVGLEFRKGSRAAPLDADRSFVIDNSNVEEVRGGSRRVVLSNAFSVFVAGSAGRGAMAIVKNQEIEVAQGGAPKTTKTGAAVAPPAAARMGLHAVRTLRNAPLAAAAVVNPLENESAVFFGRSPTGTISAAHQRTFTIRNGADGTMTLGAVTVDGANPGDFAVTQPAVTTLDRGESVDFTVQFTPGADGERTATLHIASDDEDETSFDLDLTGFGQATNATPAAVVDTLTAPAGGATTFTKLLVNDTDADSDPLKIVSVAAIDGTTDGFVEFDPETGLVAYTSPADVGTDSFEYTITDGTVTQTGTVTVTLVDPVPLAAGKTFRGEEDGDSATVTFGKLTPGAAASRRAARLPAAPPAATSTAKLAATFTEQIGNQTFRGKVSFDADDNGAEVLLAGSLDNVTTNFEITVDEDGNVKVFANGLELLPDTFDAKHPAPAAIVGIYTMALPGADLDGVGDSVASVVLRKDGVVALRGFMADGQSFKGAALLGAGNIAPFNIPLYAGRVHGRFTGELNFDPDNTAGSLTGTATWNKPPGIRGLPEPDGHVVRGELIGGFYSPDELPTPLAIAFDFGTDGDYTNFLATGTGTLAKRFTLAGTLADTTAFSLASAFNRATGLIPARGHHRPAQMDRRGVARAGDGGRQRRLHQPRGGG